MEEHFVLEAPVELAQKIIPLDELFRAFDRADAVRIDRVLVVLIELQQAAGVAHGGDDLLEHSQFVQSSQDLTQSAWFADQIQEAVDGFESHLPADTSQHSLADGPPGTVLNASVEAIGDLHQLQNLGWVGLQLRESLASRPDLLESKP